MPALTQTYVERLPRADLAGAVRTVWVQQTGDTPYVQRHLPTGGVEIHFPIGGRPQLLGPLTGPYVEVIPPRTTLVGVRFRPGMAPPFSTVLDDLVNERVDLGEVWGRSVDRLGEAMACATGPVAALDVLQAHLVRQRRVDSLIREAVRRLMPWHPLEVGTLATDLAISSSQLRRRCRQSVGLSPKALQRTLRFQGFLALAQAGVTPGVGALAADVGYADQAHLSRECQRLTGLSPRELLGGDIDRCACGHDHSASYLPFLAARDLFKPAGARRR